MGIAIVAALASGAMFAVGQVLQQSAAREQPKDLSLSWRLLASLAQRRQWLLGISCDVLSFGLQALALAFGPLTLVQPILVTGVMFAVPLAYHRRRRKPKPVVYVSTFCVAAGLALFLISSSPDAGRPTARFAVWMLVIVAVGGFVIATVLAGKSHAGVLRPSFYALGAGACFGLLAALTKTSTYLLEHGAVAFFTAWQPYTMAGVAVVGIIIQQTAYQSGPLSVSVPVLDSVEPAVSVAIGAAAFGEALAVSPLALAGEVVGVLVLLFGVVRLDRSAPVVADTQTQQEAQPAVA